MSTSTNTPITNDHRPNSGLREGNIPHAEVNAALCQHERTVIFGQQTRLRNGVLMPDDKLTRFHAGHELVRFFYQGMNKLPERILDALLEYNVSVTLVTGKDLLVFHDVRTHQSFHIGYTRKTIYMPEGVIREAIDKGYDSWAISEAIIRETWPLLDYLLILEFIRRAQLRLKSHVTLGTETVIKNALRFLNHHLAESEAAEDDEFKSFFRHYCHAFYAIDRKILGEDPYVLADKIYDEPQERIWADIKLNEITSAFEFPTLFDLDRDILHPAAYRAADIRKLPVEPKNASEMLHDICDAARFRILRQTKTNALLDKLIALGQPGILGLINVAAEEFATGQRHLSENQGDGYDTVTAFKDKLVTNSNTGPEGTIGSICHDFRDLLNYELKRKVLVQFHKFKQLPPREQRANKAYLRDLLLKMVPLKDPKKKAEHLQGETLGGGGAASEAERQAIEMLLAQVMQAKTITTLLNIAEHLIGPENPEHKHALLVAVLKKLDTHPHYHTTIRNQLRDLTGNRRLSLGNDIRQQTDTLFRSIPQQPYRLSSDPSRLRTYLDRYQAIRNKDPYNKTLFPLLAGVFIRLDRSDRYPEFVQKIRIIGTEARTILQEVVDNTNRNDPNRQTILQTAHQLLQSLK